MDHISMNQDHLLSPNNMSHLQPPGISSNVPSPGEESHIASQQMQPHHQQQGNLVVDEPNREDAVDYLNEVKLHFQDQPKVYNRFLSIMKEFETGAITIAGVIRDVSELFASRPVLIGGFNTFLPSGYRIDMEELLNSQQEQKRLPAESDARLYVAKIKRRFYNEPEVYKKFLDILHNYQRDSRSIVEVYDQVADLFGNHPDLLGEFTHFLPYPVDGTGVPAGGVDERFLQAGSAFVTDSGARGSSASAVTGRSGRGMAGRRRNAGAGNRRMRAGTSSSHSPPPPRKSNRPTRRAAQQKRYRYRYGSYDEDEDEDDLFNEDEIDAQTTAGDGRKGHLHRHGGVDDDGMDVDEEDYRVGSGGGGARSRSGGAGGGPGSGIAGASTEEEQEGEDESGRGPGSRREGDRRAKTPQPGDEKSLKSSVKQPPMASPEDLEFLKDVRASLDSPEEYTEFLHVLALYTYDILSKDEMLVLTQSLLRNYPEVNAKFQVFLASKTSHEGDDIPASLPPQTQTVRRYGPSYRMLGGLSSPSSGRTSLGESVLNDTWVSVPVGSEEWDESFIGRGGGSGGTKVNPWEIALLKSEKERYELDLCIEGCEKLLELIDELWKGIDEETPPQKDKSLSKEAKTELLSLYTKNVKGFHKAAIERLYGDKYGRDMVSLVSRAPHRAIPVLFDRLKKKLEEWRKAKNEWVPLWREIDSRNVRRALEYSGQQFKQSDRRSVTQRTLLDELMATGQPGTVTSLRTGREQLTHSRSRSPSRSSLSTDTDSSELPTAMASQFVSSYRVRGMPLSIPSIVPHVWDDLRKVLSSECGRRFEPEDKIKFELFWEQFVLPILGIGKAPKGGSGGLHVPLNIMSPPTSSSSSSAITKSPTTKFPSSRSSVFYADAPLAVFLRLVLVMAQRMSIVNSDLNASPSSLGEEANPPISTLLPTSSHMNDPLTEPPSPSESWKRIITSACSHLVGGIDAVTYEASLVDSGSQCSWLLFSLPRIAGLVVRQLHTLLANERTIQLLEAWCYERQRRRLSNALLQYRSNARAIARMQPLFVIQNTSGRGWKITAIGGGPSRSVSAQNHGSEEIEQGWISYMEKYVSGREAGEDSLKEMGGTLPLSIRNLRKCLKCFASPDSDSSSSSSSSSSSRTSNSQSGAPDTAPSTTATPATATAAALPSLVEQPAQPTTRGRGRGRGRKGGRTGGRKSPLSSPAASATPTNTANTATSTTPAETKQKSSYQGPKIPPRLLMRGRDTRTIPSDLFLAALARSHISNRLECRISMKSYKIFYVQDTSDIVYRSSSCRRGNNPKKLEHVDALRKKKWAKWLSSRTAFLGISGDFETEAPMDEDTPAVADAVVAADRTVEVEEGGRNLREERIVQESMMSI